MLHNVNILKTDSLVFMVACFYVVFVADKDMHVPAAEKYNTYVFLDKNLIVGIGNRVESLVWFSCSESQWDYDTKLLLSVCNNLKMINLA